MQCLAKVFGHTHILPWSPGKQVLQFWASWQTSFATNVGLKIHKIYIYSFFYTLMIVSIYVTMITFQIKCNVLHSWICFKILLINKFLNNIRLTIHGFYTFTKFSQCITRITSNSKQCPVVSSTLNVASMLCSSLFWGGETS